MQIGETFEERGFIYTILSENTVGLGNSSNSDNYRNGIFNNVCPKSVILPCKVGNGQIEVVEIIKNALISAPIYSIELPNSLKAIRYAGMCNLFIKELIN